MSGDACILSRRISGQGLASGGVWLASTPNSAPDKLEALLALAAKRTKHRARSGGTLEGEPARPTKSGPSRWRFGVAAEQGPSERKGKMSP